MKKLLSHKIPPLYYLLFSYLWFIFGGTTFGLWISRSEEYSLTTSLLALLLGGLCLHLDVLSSSYTIQVTRQEVHDYCFGNNIDQEWPFFCQGWSYRIRCGPKPVDARDLDISHDQNFRLAWERGWVAADELQRVFVEPDP